MRKHINKAVNKLKKTEEAVQAAQVELGLWENEKELILYEQGAVVNEDNNVNQSVTPMTPYHTPITPITPAPLTPNTQGILYSAKSKTTNGQTRFSFKLTKNKK